MQEIRVHGPKPAATAALMLDTLPGETGRKTPVDAVFRPTAEVVCQFFHGRDSELGTVRVEHFFHHHADRLCQQFLGDGKLDQGCLGQAEWPAHRRAHAFDGGVQIIQRNRL